MLEFNLKKLRFEQGLSQEELGKMLGVTKQQIGRIENGHSKLTDEKRKMLLDLFPDLQSNTVAAAAKLPDVIEIPYWDGLPEELKHPEYTHVLAQRISIEQGWGLEAENLRIVPMVGDKMTNYWYTIRANDILIIDTSYQHIAGNGVYFATSRNNTRYWIREMQVLFNDDVELKGFSPSGNTTKILTRAQLQEVDFRIIGKVVKNGSFRL